MELFLDTWFAEQKSSIPRRKGMNWNWVHIDDLAEAIVLTCKHRTAVAGEILDISAQYISYEEVRIAFAKIAGHKGNVEFHESKGEKGTWDEVMLQNVKVRNQKARDMLGWYPKHLSLLDELEIYYAAYLAHRKK